MRLKTFICLGPVVFCGTALLILSLYFYLRVKLGGPLYAVTDEGKSRMNLSQGLAVAKALFHRNSDKADRMLSDLNHLAIPDKLPLYDLFLVYISFVALAVGVLSGFFSFFLEVTANMECTQISWWPPWEESSGPAAVVIRSLASKLSAIFC